MTNRASDAVLHMYAWVRACRWAFKTGVECIPLVQMCGGWVMMVLSMNLFLVVTDYAIRNESSVLGLWGILF
jgi:hypothetical protein